MLNRKVLFNKNLNFNIRLSSGLLVQKRYLLEFIGPFWQDFFASGKESVKQAFKRLMDKKPETHRHNVANIITKLSKPYIPIVPEWRPVFKRSEDWEAVFLRSMESRFYHCYYGPSGCGKSVAISQSLRNREGVIHLSGRFARSPQELFNNLASASGFRDTISNDNVNESELLVSLLDAGRVWKTGTNVPLKVFIQDLDDTEMENRKAFRSLSRPFLEFYSRGLANVVYTITDFSAIFDLHSTSGHTSRLTYSLFPDISDDQLEKQLLEIPIHKYKPNLQPATELDGTWNDLTPETHTKLIKELINPQHVKMLVEQIGSQMNDLTEILYRHYEDGIPCAELIEKLFARRAGDIYNFFIKLKNAEQIFIFHQIFELLLKSDGKAVRWDDIYVEYELELADVHSFVRTLVHENLLAFVDSKYVRMHSRATLAGYKIAQMEPVFQTQTGLAKQQVKRRIK